MMETRLIVMAVVCLCIAQLAFAVEQNYAFTNDKLQYRFSNICKETRCVVCQNQTLFDSNSALASDMRRQIYTMLNTGMSNRQIHKYMRDRYGDSILFMPPWRVGTILLWLGPLLMLGIAALSLRWFFTRHKLQSYAC